MECLLALPRRGESLGHSRTPETRATTPSIRDCLRPFVSLRNVLPRAHFRPFGLPFPRPSNAAALTNSIVSSPMHIA